MTEESVVISHDHDPRNARESIREVLRKFREKMDNTCPGCGEEIWRVQGSVGMVFIDDEVSVRHVTGTSCTIPVNVNRNDEGNAGVQE